MSLPSLKELAGMKLEEQARYCDQICAKLLQEQRADLFKDWLSVNPPNFQKYNHASIGNLAAIALRCNDPDCRLMAVNLLDKYKHWQQDRCTII